MKNKKKKILTISIIVAIIFSIISLKFTIGANTDNTRYAEEVVKLVNIERAKGGLSPLTANIPGLNSAAMLRAEEIIVYWSHTRPDGRGPFTTLDEFNVPRSAAGENIAKGQRSPQEVVTGWMNSTGHRENIMNENFNHIGVGIAVNNNGQIHWVQLFIRCNVSNCVGCNAPVTPPVTSTATSRPTSPQTSPSTSPANAASTATTVNGTSPPTSPPTTPANVTSATTPPTSPITTLPPSTEPPASPTFKVGRILPNDDRDVAMGDAIQIFRFIGNLNSSIPQNNPNSREWQAALINPPRTTGTPQMSDAIEIFRHIAGLNNSIPK